MGSHTIPQRSDDGSLHVLVTGFDAFGRHERNPSWQIARTLPDFLPATKKGGRKIRIHVRPQPVRVSYTYVREQVPPLIFSNNEDEGLGSVPNFDLVVHIGVSHARGYYEMETRAFRDDYYLHDVDGKAKPESLPSWRDQGAPKMLNIGFDSVAVLEEWKKLIPDADVRVSTDAGRFLCEYILFTTLLEYHRNLSGQGAPVTFFHVPTENEDKDIEKGKQVAIALIKALAQNMPQ